MSTLLQLSDLDKSFDEHRVLAGVTLGVESGEVLVLLGPSGSGKTTLLRLIAGFERPDRGRIELAGEEITRQPPARRNFGMVFQHYALFPHLTVGENVAFGLESRKLPGAQRRARVAEVLELVELPGFEARRVQEISGGQQQRVAVARALAPEPRLLLLDEPLSNLDPELRERTRRELRRAIERVGITAVWVTHEQEEAFDVGDRVAILDRGRLEQVGSPEELYLEPASRFVASFLGRASFLRGERLEGGWVLLGDERFIGCAARWPAGGGEELPVGAQVDLMLRPEALGLVSSEADEGLLGTVLERRYAGEATFYRVRLDGLDEILVAAGPRSARTGGRVKVTLREAGPPPRIFRPREGAAA